MSTFQVKSSSHYLFLQFKQTQKIDAKNRIVSLKERLAVFERDVNPSPSSAMKGQIKHADLGGWKETSQEGDKGT